MAGISLGLAGYVFVFGLAAAGCFGSVFRARKVEDAATRRGLVGLLACSGGWAATELAYLLVPGPALKYGAYLASLVVGLATVGAWLYFCSAYTGRQFHRHPSYRRAAVGLYLGIVAVKLTNPLHGQYFSTRLVGEPFVHVAIEHGVFHWVVTGLSYVLVAVGFFMLYEMFIEADYDTRPLGAVMAVTGLPAAFDVVGVTTPLLLDLNHEPLGVAVFALGVLYVYEERFLSVQVTGDVDDPVVFLGDDGRVRDFNEHARSLFPELAGAVGRRFESVLPDARDAADSEDGVLERTEDGETRYYLVGETTFRLGQTDVGEVLVFGDVTDTERRRRELERQNDQFEGLAAAMRHELRNTLQILRGRVAIAGDALDEGDVNRARESFETASETTDRMERVVDDLSALAQYGQTLGGTDWVAFGAAVEGAWERFDDADLSLSVESEGYVEAEPGRLRELLANAFEFAAHNDASTVTVSLHEGSFAVADDGRSPDGVDTEAFFEYDGAVPHAETGVTLPNLRTLARVHGWTATIDESYREGIRVVVSGVRTDPATTAPEVGSTTAGNDS